MAAAALTARTTAAASLQRTIKEVERYRSSTNPSKRLLQSKREKLLSQKDELFSKHCIYAEKSNKDLGSEEMNELIDPLLDSTDDLADTVYLMIEDFDVQAADEQRNRDDTSHEQTKQNEIHVAELQYEADERTLRDRVTVMMVTVNDETKTSKEAATLVQTYMNQIDECLRIQPNPGTS